MPSSLVSVYPAHVQQILALQAAELRGQVSALSLQAAERTQELTRLQEASEQQIAQLRAAHEEALERMQLQHLQATMQLTVGVHPAASRTAPLSQLA